MGYMADRISTNPKTLGYFRLIGQRSSLLMDPR